MANIHIKLATWNGTKKKSEIGRYNGDDDDDDVIHPNQKNLDTFRNTERSSLYRRQ